MLLKTHAVRHLDNLSSSPGPGVVIAAGVRSGFHELPISASDRAKGFGCYKCGANFLFGWEATKSEKDSTGYLHIKNGDEFIGGIPPAQYYDPGVPPHWLIYFQVSNCDDSVAKATGMNAQVLFSPSDIPNTGRMAILRDPQGAAFAVFQPSRH